MRYLLILLALIFVVLAFKYILTVAFIVMFLLWVLGGLNPIEQALIVLAAVGLAKR